MSNHLIVGNSAQEANPSIYPKLIARELYSSAMFAFANHPVLEITTLIL